MIKPVDFSDPRCGISVVPVSRCTRRSSLLLLIHPLQVGLQYVFSVRTVH